jgi:magnesium chelatase family protein
VSLAHGGVLFLDELPEFHRHVLEVLRQPLEDGIVTLARASARLTYPARFTLVAAMNPCPCGHLGDALRPCRCGPVVVERYLGRISGPLLDRIDIHLRVPAVVWADLAGEKHEEPSAVIRARVEAALERERERFRSAAGSGAASGAAGTGTMGGAPGAVGIRANAHMTAREVRRYCRGSAEVETILRVAAERLGLSARACHRVLKLARTIADLAGSESVEPEHVREGIQYRSLDRRAPLPAPTSG